MAPAARAAGAGVVREERLDAAVPVYHHPGWARRFPWLVQGTTGRGAPEAPFDFGVFGSRPSGQVLANWRALRQATGCRRAVHASQVHGNRVVVHDGGPPGLLVADAADGHVTRRAGVLLTVSVADCVPIFVVDAARRAAAVLHGGWRGVAAGILEAGIETLRRVAGSEPGELYVHFGPAICGECYEVGPEVHVALGRPAPGGPRPVDLRGELWRRATGLGVPEDRLSRSAFCTRCSHSAFYSHRAGCAERQLGVLGLRDEAG